MKELEDIKTILDQLAETCECLWDSHVEDAYRGFERFPDWHIEGDFNNMFIVFLVSNNLQTICIKIWWYYDHLSFRFWSLCNAPFDIFKIMETKTSYLGWWNTIFHGKNISVKLKNGLKILIRSPPYSSQFCPIQMRVLDRKYIKNIRKSVFNNREVEVLDKSDI